MKVDDLEIYDLSFLVTEPDVMKMKTADETKEWFDYLYARVLMSDSGYVVVSDRGQEILKIPVYMLPSGQGIGPQKDYPLFHPIRLTDSLRIDHPGWGFVIPKIRKKGATEK